MVELLIGKKGTGKTKALIEKVNAASTVANGNVVFISSNTSKNMYDIKTAVRMYDTSEFDIKSYDEFFGFICGIVSGNFDITHVFVDGFLKIVGTELDGMEAFLAKIDEMGKKFDITFEISVSIDVDAAPDYIKKYA